MKLKSNCLALCSMISVLWFPKHCVLYGNTMMDRVQEFSISECNTPSSEPFSGEFFTSWTTISCSSKCLCHGIGWCNKVFSWYSFSIGQVSGAGRGARLATQLQQSTCDTEITAWHVDMYILYPASESEKVPVQLHLKFVVLIHMLPHNISPFL